MFSELSPHWGSYRRMEFVPQQKYGKELVHIVKAKSSEK